MRAIYKSSLPYLQLSRDEVLNTVRAYSAPYTVRDYRYSGVDEKTGYRNSANLFKPVSCVGTFTRVSDPSHPVFYLFSEGEKHNQLTFTDPFEIRCMREYIKRRGTSDSLIREVLFEGNGAELEDPVLEAVQAAEPIKKDPVEDYEELSEWDRKYLNNLIRR